MRENEQYLPRFFIIEEGSRGFHERLHYWQHLGSTFGAFQIIGFHITAKAMRITIRDLLASARMEVPIKEHILESLYGRIKDVRDQTVWNFFRLLKCFEFAGLTKPIHLKVLDDNAQFYGGWHERQPLFKIKKHIGVPFAANHLKEIHATAISKLCCEEESLGIVEAEIWNRAEEIFREDTPKWIALLYDWALMCPNPNTIDNKPGEIHPGSRFLKGLDVLANADSETLKAMQGLSDLSFYISNILGWRNIDTSLKHYESFIHLAKKGANNKKDADRNRKIYSAIVGILETAQDVRLKYPEAFALPHLYESTLKEKLPPIALKKGRKLKIFSTKYTPIGEGSDWYVPYLANVSLVLQAFGYKEQNQDKIACVYRHLGIEENCSFLRTASKDSVCYTYPCFDESPKIRCGFFELCRELGLYQDD
jgi:hypothetical protein